MANIHVNTDVMRHLGQIFVQLDGQLENQIIPQIHSGISQLESDWQGISRQRFEELFQEWRTLANRLSQQGEELGRHLQYTAERFENVDETA